MRIELTLHHWVTIFLVLESNLVLYYAAGDYSILRGVFAVTLYMLTEQNVFIGMLCYRSESFQIPFLFDISAWYYLFSRIAIVGFNFYTWDSVFHGQYNNGVIYHGYILLPAANGILGITQLADHC